MAPAALEALSTLRTRMSTSPTRAISRASTVYGTLSAGPVSAPDTLPAPGCSRPAEVEVRVRAGMSPPSPGLLVAPARAAPEALRACMAAGSFAASPAGRGTARWERSAGLGALVDCKDTPGCGTMRISYPAATAARAASAAASAQALGRARRGRVAV